MAFLAAAGPGAGAVEVWPTATWRDTTPAAAGMQTALLEQGVAFAQGYGGSGIVVRGGRRVRFWGDQAQLFQLYSATKSFGSIATGLAIGDGLTTLGSFVQPALPELTAPPDPDNAAWLPLVTVERLLTHSAGFSKVGGIVPLLFQPGTAWSYSDAGANWMADYLTVRFGRDLDTVLRPRVFEPLGISATALTWRMNKYRDKRLRGIVRREFGAGISASVDAMARIGLMLLRDGRWRGGRILPAGYVAQARTARPSIARLEPFDPRTYPEAPRHYGLFFWNNADGVLQGAPTDTFWAWGLDDELIFVVPSLDLVVARAGPTIEPHRFGSIASLQPFFGPIARSVIRPNAAPAVDAGAD